MAALARGRIKAVDAVGYWIAQIGAGALAALVVRATVSKTVNPIALHAHALASALVVELLFTFALGYVVLNVATSRDHPDNSFYGLAIGFTVAAGVVAVGGISGGAFNPAVVVGGIVMGLFSSSALSYLVAQLVGGMAAGIAFRALNPADR